MRGIGILAAGALALGGVVLLRGTGGSPPVPTAAGRPATTRMTAPSPLPPEPTTPAPAHGETPLEAALRGAPLRDLSPDVLSGPLAVEGGGDVSAPPEELALTASQQAIVQALLSDRESVLRELRARITERPPGESDADAIVARAEQAQAGFLAALRGTLLPDQRERFEALYRAGKWGGYTLVIPVRR